MDRLGLRPIMGEGVERLVRLELRLGLRLGEGEQRLVRPRCLDRMGEGKEGPLRLVILGGCA